MLPTSCLGSCGSAYSLSYKVSLSQLILTFRLIFKLTFICPPQTLPPSYYSSFRSNLTTAYIIGSYSRLTKSSEISFSLSACTNIFLITPKVYTLSQFSSLRHQKTIFMMPSVHTFSLSLCLS